MAVYVWSYITVHHGLCKYKESAGQLSQTVDHCPATKGNLVYCPAAACFSVGQQCCATLSDQKLMIQNPALQLTWAFRHYWEIQVQVRAGNMAGGEGAVGPAPDIRDQQPGNATPMPELIQIYNVEGVNIQVCTLAVQWYDLPCSVHAILGSNPAIMQKQNPLHTLCTGMYFDAIKVY
jgi:hypothetical protein